MSHTSAICVVCQLKAVEYPRVCSSCRPKLAKDLRDLHAAWLALDATPGRAGAEPVSGSKVAPLGANIGVLDLLVPVGIARPVLDPHKDQVGVQPVAVVLHQWVRDWAELRDEHLPGATVPEMSAWLEVRTEWACDEHPAVDEYASEIRSTLAACRSTEDPGHVGDDLISIGPCAAERNDGTRCGYRLRADPYLDNVTCKACQTRWGREYWLWLAGLEVEETPENCHTPSGE